MTDRTEIHAPSRAYGQSDKRIWVTVALLVLVAAVFWLGSRYPSLNEKALMGAEAPTAGLAFDILIEISDNDRAWFRAAAHFVNWSYTNWRGMSFGILFGAVLVTLLPLLERRSFQSSWLNAAMGIVVGAPLGVCVNCVAPIAQGLARSGAALETTLGVLVASPMLNVIVLTMSFSLLPFYMALTKIGMTLVLILFLIPLFCRFVGPSLPVTPAQVSRVDRPSGAWARFVAVGKTLTEADGLPEPHWLRAGIWVLRRSLRNFALLAVMTVPMMLLAGLIGSILVTFFPLRSFIHFYDVFFLGPFLSVLGLVILASFAVLLPVPIAFDVVIVAILMAAGLDHKSALALLMALGSYSMVAFLILGQTLSYRIAASFGVLVVGVATVAGLIGEVGERTLLDRAQARVLASGADLPAPRILQTLQMPGPARVPSSAPQVRYTPRVAQIDHTGPGEVSLRSAALSAQGSTPRPTQDGFVREMGPSLGLDQTGVLTEAFATTAHRPFRGITAGDINQDGWVDLVMVAEETGTGVRVYLNRGGVFERMPWSLGALDTTAVAAIALVDLDNDGWLDLFASGLDTGPVVFENQNGRFEAEHIKMITGVNAFLYPTPAFGDLDQDGDLDIFLGGHAGGSAVSPYFATEAARSAVAWNDAGAFKIEPLATDLVPGQTLTAVIWDINADGWPDVLVGEDFEPTDKVLLNRGNRRFELMAGSVTTIPHLTMTSMSFDFGDIDNDLVPEFYAAQINRAAGTHRLPPSAPCEQLVADGALSADQLGACSQFHSGLRELSSRRHRNRAIECLSTDRARGSGLCRVAAKLQEAHRYRDPTLCQGIPATWPTVGHVCELAKHKLYPNAEVEAFGERSVGVGSPRHNVLLAGDAVDGFADIAAATKTDAAGWGWSSRFTDLDQDGLQDLFVATGHWTMGGFASNTYFRNLGNRQFEQAQDRFGLTDHLPTYGYVLLDFDRDGDVDIIRAQTFGPAVVHRNASPAGGAIWVRLEDRRGNSKGIGAQVILHVGEIEMRRDVKAGGGFQSIDDAVAHFGLGAATNISGIRVIWPDGARTHVTIDVQANQEIVISRR